MKRARIGVRSRAIDSGAFRRAAAPRQKQLPLPWQYVRPRVQDNFAHPSEEELARILTFYRIRWLYEPTSFVLSRDADGRPAESFTPDFYLPDHRLYIELTTMRQPLVTRKNRKLRRLKEMYPGVQIKLLYRRDVERLLSSYNDSWNAPAGGEPASTVVSEGELASRIRELAASIAEWRGSRTDCPSEDVGPLCLVGLAPGALTMKRHLGAELRGRGVEIELDRTVITRYRTPKGRKFVRLAKAPKTRVAGRDVLVIADVVNTGFGVAYLVDWLRRNGARRVEVCAMFSRTSTRLIELPLRFVGFEAPDEPIVGFGIGARARHSALPYVATLGEKDADLQLAGAGTAVPEGTECG